MTGEGPQVPAAAPAAAPPLNLNPITNPTHPAHLKAARHMGAAIAHLMLGNGEAAAPHLGHAIGHMVAPHMPEAVGAQTTTALKSAAHGKRAR